MQTINSQASHIKLNKLDRHRDLCHNKVYETYCQLPMILPGKFKRLAEGYPNLNNTELIEYFQFLLDTEQVTEETRRHVDYFLMEGFLYYVPVA